MNFQLVYDIQQSECHAGFLPMVFGAIAAVCAFDWYRGKKWALSNGASRPYYSPRSAFFFFGALALVTYVLTWGSYFTLTRELGTGAATTLEGVVGDFHPAQSPKAHESFVLDGHVFSYSHYAVQQGFNTLQRDGGPIADGIYVRLACSGGSILKLEIRR